MRITAGSSCRAGALDELHEALLNHGDDASEEQGEQHRSGASQEMPSPACSSRISAIRAAILWLEPIPSVTTASPGRSLWPT